MRNKAKKSKRKTSKLSQKELNKLWRQLVKASNKEQSVKFI